MAAVTICSDFGAQENKVCHCFHCFPIYLPWSYGTGCHDICFFESLDLNQFFPSPPLLSSRGSSVPLLSAIRVFPSAYLSLLTFLPEILIPACASSSPAFLKMYSAYKLNKQGQCTALTYSFFYLEAVCCSISSSNRCFLTIIQVSQEAGQVVWYSHLFQNFPQFIVILTKTLA